MIRNLTRFFILSLLPAVAVGACSDDKTGPSDASVTGGDGGTSDGGATDGTSSAADLAAADGSTAITLETPAAGKGVQIKMMSTLTAGLETERCMFYKVPAEGLNVVKQEIKFTPGSHHILIYVTPYKDTFPTKTLSGVTLDTSGVFDCGMNGPTGDWDVTGLMGGAQSPNGPPTIDGLPDGTAIKVAGGTILMVNTHYLNASDKPLDTLAFINLHSIASDKVVQEAGVLFWYNPFIMVPAAGDGVARQRCPISSDITLIIAQSHMHRRGVGYTATVLDATNTPEAAPFYRTTQWADIDSQKLNPGKMLKAGQFIDYACSYTNSETRVVTQGRTTKDEMCVFTGVYYPRHVKTEYCSMTDDFSGRYMGGLWIGNGTKTGLETAGCFQSAAPTSSDKGASFYGCVTSSCPKIAKETSDVARCLATNGLGMCGTDCGAAGSGAACKTCISGKCASYFQTLGAAGCQ